MMQKSSHDLSEKSDLSLLVERLRAGDRTVAELIIESNITVAKRIAKYYSKWYPDKSDDIRGAAFVGLTQAVTWAYEGRMYDNNIIPYIAKTVDRFIKDFLEKDHLIRIPRSAFREMIQRMEAIQFLPIAFPLHIRNDDEENSADEEIIEPAAPVDTDPLELMEFFDRLALTEFEKIVLTQKSEGRTLHEIAEMTGKSHVWIYKTLENIRERADRLRRSKYDE